MIWNWNKKIFNSIILSLSCYLVFLDNKFFSNETLNDSVWRKLSKSYNYKTEKKEWNTNMDSSGTNVNINWWETNDNLFKIVSFMIFTIILGFVIYWLISNTKKRANKKIEAIKKDIKVDNIEKNLEETDISPFLTKAINKKEWRICIRLYFLLILKKLSEKKFIQWKIDKTNNLYLKELSVHSFYPDFNRIVLAYEKAWYGKKNISEEQFKEVEKLFISLLKTIDEK